MALTLITMKQTAALTGKHHLYIRRMIRAGTFPAPVRIIEDRTRLYFDSKAIRAWIKTHAAWKADCAIRARDCHRHLAGVKIVEGKAVRQRGTGGTGLDSDQRAMAAREAGNQDFTDAEGCNDAAAKALAASAEDRIRKGLATGEQVQL